MSTSLGPIMEKKRRIVTISYTGLDAGGGVPKFNRDIHYAAFPDRSTRHFCWQDFPWHPEIDARGETEWGRARILNEYLVRSRLISSDDVVIADGFWGAGLEHLPLAISHSHGIWSHLTLADVQAGKAPDMPYHHAAQVAFRQRWKELGKSITAVSDFIADQLRLQWGIVVDRVINNGVDTSAWIPREYEVSRRRPVIIHGVNDPSNANKGWDHITTLQGRVDADIMSLDEACQFFQSTPRFALAQADLVVHPSGYEGNSMFVAEALSCGVPFVGYDVGFAYWIAKNVDWHCRVGAILARDSRSWEMTLGWTKHVLEELPSQGKILRQNARTVALRNLSIERFSTGWREYVSNLESRYDS